MAKRHQSSRRDFLRGKAATDVLRDVATELEGQAGEALGALACGASTREAGYLLRFGRRAMACEFEILLNAGQYPNAPESALAALDLVDELESQLSVFRDDSEVSRINQSAHEREIEVEPKLFALLMLAAQIHRETLGAYDITSGPLTKAWGFYRREGRVPSEAELADVLRSVGLQHIEFDSRRSTIRFRIRGMEINLGSIGKGYALDRVAELLASKGIENLLLHGGNSSVVGHGGRGISTDHDHLAESSAAQPRTGGWWIGLRHPLVPEQRIGELLLCDRALGTSGSGTQFFAHAEQRYGHILDPRTGRPAEGMLSVTVAAPSGAQADALATAFYVLGTDASIEYCRQHPGVSAVFMSPGANNQVVELTVFGLLDDEIRCYDDPSISVRRLER